MKRCSSDLARAGRRAALRHAAARRGRGSGWPTSSASSTRAGYAGYFLIVQDFIAAARERGIPVGPGRGSAAGSIVAYALGITDVCPLKFDLLFERFLNPERVSMPDIDVDFCFERRGEVIEYVRERYGRDSVGPDRHLRDHEGARGGQGRRPGAPDPARRGRPDHQADPVGAGLQPARSPRRRRRWTSCASWCRANPAYRRLLDLSSRIEGISRHMSVHAAGVVIAPGPLAEYVPVCTAPTKGAGAGADGEESIITQYEMGALEKVGMLKMDMLGLKTLTVIHDAVQMIADRHGERRSTWTRSPFDDPKVYELLRQGRTAGVFQFESPLATDTLRGDEVRPVRRPGRLATPCSAPGRSTPGCTPSSSGGSWARSRCTYPHPSLQEMLEPTYGVITYQEQVMRIANVLAGFTPGRSRRAPEGGGQEGRGADQEGARQVRASGPWPWATRRSWSTSWRRRSRPSAATASTSRTRWRTRSCRTRPRGSRRTIPPSSWRRCCRRKSATPTRWCSTSTRPASSELEVLPPDVNESGFKFTVVGDQRIRFGLGAVRNVGWGAIESIIAARQRRRRSPTLADLVERIDLRLCNKRVLESLVAAGACDSPGRPPQAAHARRSTRCSARRSCCSRRREAGQESLFGEVARRRGARGRWACPTCRPGPRPSGWPRRRRCSGSSSRATRWSGSATRWSCSAPAPPPRWASGASTR